MVKRLVQSLSVAKGNEAAMKLIAQDWATKWFANQDELHKTKAMLSSAQSQIAAMTDSIRAVGGHCSGCLHFRGLQGCAIGRLDECGLGNDLYESKFSDQKEDAQCG